jgi:hypothetical protein
MLPTDVQQIDGRDVRFPLPRYGSDPLGCHDDKDFEPGAIPYSIESVDG